MEVTVPEPRSRPDQEPIRCQSDHPGPSCSTAKKFTRNQLLNKDERILADLTPAELVVENRKEFQLPAAHINTVQPGRGPSGNGTDALGSVRAITRGGRSSHR
ncbi:hypothetical protein [Ilumatobacter nonamiensis]|uniref:hypothetical protein n=1 Tax=Ilumatobacter nonamiensis TaxID=467093 RepID=UPI0011D26743|nr:hypothetical protein [Ilumatobacter nonamiensis]